MKKRSEINFETVFPRRDSQYADFDPEPLRMLAESVFFLLPFPAPRIERFQAPVVEDAQFLAVFQRRRPEIFFEFRDEITRIVVTAFLRHIFDRQRIAPQ